jgi:hypothetical protein
VLEKRDYKKQWCGSTWPGGPGWIEKQETEIGISVSMLFKPQVTCGWGKIWTVLVGQARVIDSYSAYAYKLTHRYFNHMHGV